MTDYKLALMKILKCFGEQEGVWYEREWRNYGISEEDEKAIVAAYEEFENK